jgi:pantetheine-phosphate adenylyltransferase
MRVGIYPGSFDPVTYGHRDIIQRASRLVDQLYVAVASNPYKQPFFEIPERIQMLEKCFEGTRNVIFDHFNGLLVTYAKEKGATVIFKGLRAFSDFENEFRMALANRELAPEVETVFLMTSHQYAYLSSSLVKEIVSLGGNLKGMVPPFVEKKLKNYIKNRRGKKF